MSEPKIFRVNWPTGGIRVYVGNFFSTVDTATRNELLKLAKIYCTSEQQVALLMDLEEEKQGRMKKQRDRIDKCIKKIMKQKWG